MELVDESASILSPGDVYPNLPQRSRNNIARGEDRVSRLVVDLYLSRSFHREAGVFPLSLSLFLRCSSPILSFVWGLRALLQREKVTFAFGARLHRSCDGLLA